MKISHEGLALIKHFESLRLKAYVCPAGKWTIGFGSTGPHVKPGMVITEDDANNLLTADLVRFERAVDELVLVPLEQHEADSLISFTFNVGIGAFKGSTLLRRVNVGNKTSAAKEFLRWDKSGGKVLPGLTKRRKAEAKLFVGEGFDPRALA